RQRGAAVEVADAAAGGLARGRGQLPPAGAGGARPAQAPRAIRLSLFGVPAQPGEHPLFGVFFWGFWGGGGGLLAGSAGGGGGVGRNVSHTEPTAGTTTGAVCGLAASRWWTSMRWFTGLRNPRRAQVSA